MKYRKLWDVTKAVLKGKFISVNAYIKKKKTIWNQLPNHFEELKKKKKCKNYIQSW